MDTSFFDNTLNLSVAWFKATAPPKATGVRQGMRHGYYFADTRTIYLNPILSQSSWIPQYFVSGVIFHECCHSFIPPELVRGRDGKPYLEWHTQDFFRAEAKYPHLARMHSWEQRNLDRLLRADGRLNKALLAASKREAANHDD